MQGYRRSLSAKLSVVKHYNLPSPAAVGAGIYIAGFSIPLGFKLDIQLIALVFFTLLSVISAFLLKKRPIVNSTLNIPIYIFLFITCVSIFLSRDMGRSLQLSVPLLPAVLLFFLISGYFNDTKDLRFLYGTFSLLIAGLSLLLLMGFWSDRNIEPTSWISNFGSTIFVVKNDIAFLSVLTPLSLALAYRNLRSLSGIIAALSVILAVIVTGIFQSKGAMLALVVSVTCFALLIKPRLALLFGFTTIIAVLAIDWFMGFPLIHKFILGWEGRGRIPLWISAWKMFLDAPMFGNGPHTFVLFYKEHLRNLDLPSWLYVDPRVIPWPHNLYMEIIAEWGIAGLTAFGFLTASGLSSAWKLRRSPSNEVRILGYGVFASLISFFTAAIFELTFLRQWVVLIMYVLFGITAKLSTFKYQEAQNG
jgi:O-antigen ligase